MINVLKYDTPYELLLDVKGYDVAYAVSGEADDYVAETSEPPTFIDGASINKQPALFQWSAVVLFLKASLARI